MLNTMVYSHTLSKNINARKSAIKAYAIILSDSVSVFMCENGTVAF